MKRVRIDAELKGEVARASETARARGGKEAADLARLAEGAGAWIAGQRGAGWRSPTPSLNMRSAGETVRVNVEVATGHYSAKSIAGKAAAGFAVHASTSRASRRIARALGRGDNDHRAGGGGSRDEPSIEI